MRGYEIHAIAGLSDAAFQAVVESGDLSKADVAAAKALRAGRGMTKRVGGEVDIRKREESKMESMVEKIERAQGHAAALNDSVTAYAEMHKCSRAIAMEKVLAHPSTSQYHRLDKALMAAQREAAALHKLEGVAPGNHPINRSTPARTPPTVKPSESGPAPEDSAPTADSDLSRTAAEVLGMIADAQMRANPAMTRARATSMAALDPRFSAAHRDEKMRKGL
jgi:hypothetical protein